MRVNGGFQLESLLQPDPLVSQVDQFLNALAAVVPRNFLMRVPHTRSIGLLWGAYLGKKWIVIRQPQWARYFRTRRQS